jgi:ABC-type multidrug transport system ATPase subunit
MQLCQSLRRPLQGRLTVLVGPPSCGKTTFLKLLSGRLPTTFYSGSVKYNGHDLSEFCAQRSVAYVAQTDTHIPNLTARETVKFAYDVQHNTEGKPAQTFVIHL